MRLVASTKHLVDFDYDGKKGLENLKIQPAGREVVSVLIVSIMGLAHIVPKGPVISMFDDNSRQKQTRLNLAKESCK